jgi:hypothetical protein
MWFLGFDFTVVTSPLLDTGVDGHHAILQHAT